MKLDFHGKTILVTGATRGIGLQIANDLYELGANLILTGTNPIEIAKLNEKYATLSPTRKYFALNLLQNKSLDDFIEKLESVEIHGIVNNAGINRLNSIQQAERDDWNDMLSVNLTAPFRLIHSLSERMIQQKYGRIVNIASIFSVISKERRSVYSATKFGLNGLTVGASNDLARFNVLCNTLSPGFVLTDLTRKNLSDKEMNDLEDIIPAKRLANVADISNVALFLLSDLNNYLTGQNIIVDGGFTNV
jgi:3-oxoacyl-[acyl-carrier protein] reductase